jgi:hypothetical protein
MECEKYLPQAICLNFRIHEIVKQLSETQVKTCKIDAVIGSTTSTGSALISKKIQLMHNLQGVTFGGRYLKIHLDYSEDMNTTCKDDFLKQNNVHFLIQLTDDGDQVMLKDCHNGATHWQYVKLDKVREAIKALI